MNADDRPTHPDITALRSPETRCRLAIVEPDRLTRWSLSAYLANTFDVVTVESTADAGRLLEESPVDAIVISDDLADDGADRIEACARRRNADVVVIRTVTARARSETVGPRTVCLEKPFKLSVLAKLLDVAFERPNGRSR